MRLKWIAVLAVALLAVQVSAEEPIVLKTQKDQISYAVGVDLARSLRSSRVELELRDLAAGLKDEFSGEKLLMTEEQFWAAMTVFQNEMAREEVAVKRIGPDVSYAIGVDAARKFKWQGVELDLDLLVKGLRDVLSGEKLLMTESKLRISMNLFQKEVSQKRNRGRMMLTRDRENNRKEGDAFLVANKTKEGVLTLPSGLQYRVLKEGAGKKPAEADTVEVNYRGTLIDGTEFDNSYKRGNPGSFQVDKVIRGWTEALLLMKEGSKWQLFIPPELGYGERGTGPIPPSSTLIFEIELVSVK